MIVKSYLRRMLAGAGVLLMCYVQVGLLGCVSAELPEPVEAPQEVAEEGEERERFQLFSRERSGERAEGERDERGDSSVRETVSDIADAVNQYTTPTGVFWTAAREKISAPTYQQLIALTAGVCIAALCAVAASSVLG